MDLPDPATPAIEGDPWTSLAWMTQRVRLLEEQRQTLRREREWERAQVTYLKETLAIAIGPSPI